MNENNRRVTILVLYKSEILTKSTLEHFQLTYSCEIRKIHCVRAKREHILFLTGRPVANAPSQGVLRFWFLTSIWPPRRIYQGLNWCEQPLCLTNKMNQADVLTNKLNRADVLTTLDKTNWLGSSSDFKASEQSCCVLC